MCLLSLHTDLPGSKDGLTSLISSAARSVLFGIEVHFCLLKDHWIK